MRKNYLFLIFLSFSIAAFSQVGINTTNPNAALDIEASNSTSPSSSDGLLIPRIDAFPSTDPGSAQNGMLVYLTATDNGNAPGFYYWENFSGEWTSIGSGSSGGGSSSGTAWDIQGNSGTNTTSNFIGTTDNVGLVFRTNNSAKLRISTSGQLETLNTGNSIFIGTSAGASDDLTTNNNVFIGYQAAQNADTGNDNIAIGRQAGQNIASGAENIAIGRQALQNIGDGAGNIAIGHNAGATAGLFTSSPDATLWIENSAGSSPLIGGDFANNRVGINVDLSNLTNLTHTLTVNGNIYGDNIYTSGGQLTPDYVFEKYYLGNSEILPSYNFHTLEYAENFVKENGHLPGVLSYKDIKNQDYVYDLSQFSRTNLEKIEESFLYITELNAKIKAQDKELKEKEDKIEDLEQRLAKLEKILLKK